MQKVVIPVVATVLVVAAMLYQARTVDPILCEPPPVHLGEIAGFTSSPIEVSESERHTLPEDTGFDKRRYVDEDGNWFSVSLVLGGRSKSSIHRPELCLPSQGFQMMNPRKLEVDGVEWHVLSLAHRDAQSMSLSYTFFNQTGFRTSSHLHRIFVDVWDRSILGRIDRWVMVTVNASTDDDRKVAAFLQNLKGVIVR